jgi:hypothetical protein
MTGQQGGCQDGCLVEHRIPRDIANPRIVRGAEESRELVFGLLPVFVPNPDRPARFALLVNRGEFAWHPQIG